MAGDFILSLRIKARGGYQLEKIYEEKPPNPGLKWVIFIHGFHVHREKALRQWGVLRSIIGIDYDATQIQPGLLLWPSDQSIIYSEMIDYAEEAGRKLGLYLEEHPGSPAVLLGHSMGARVALEAADYMRGGQLRGFVLLGAAVGVSKFKRFQRYDRTHAEREAVAFSPADKTLKRWFTAGEKAAAPFSEIGDAVGLQGHPESREWKREPSNSNDHSYWKLKVSGELTQWALGSTGAGQHPKEWTPAEHHSEQRDVYP
jgi:pimeloyl-ACP methyl ester carboxylesterase